MFGFFNGRDCVVRKVGGEAGEVLGRVEGISGTWCLGANVDKKARHCLSETSLPGFLIDISERRNELLISPPADK